MKIALLGYGKMGKVIERLALERGDEIVLKVDRHNRDAVKGADFKVAELVIEFSNPEAAYGNIKMCLEAGVPVVCGTTGWLDQFAEVEKLVKEHRGAFFYASNYSIGVNVFFAVNKYLAGLMSKVEGYTASLSETHHTQKLDAPSGTAITLAEDITAQTGLTDWKLTDEIWLDPQQEAYNRVAAKTTPLGTRGRAEGRPQQGSLATLKSQKNNYTEAVNSLPIISYRKESVPGTHQIEYTSAQDTLRIEHQAHSREGFALGALAAAHWLKDKQGIFGMNDLLEPEQL